MKLSIKTLGILTPFLASILSFTSPVASVVTAATSNLPDNLRPSNNEQLFLTLKAQGVQIYQCQAKEDDSGEFAWSLKAPEADLFDRLNNKVGKHYVGPVWESNDGSKVLAEVKKKTDVKKSNAIPWLLLSTKKVEGNGVFSKVTSIQRFETIGGVAPKNNCNRTAVGQEIRIPYTANYNFYNAKP
jgi:Protein of unknown function (DUF3455)